MRTTNNEESTVLDDKYFSWQDYKVRVNEMVTELNTWSRTPQVLLTTNYYLLLTTNSSSLYVSPHLLRPHK